MEKEKVLTVIKGQEFKLSLKDKIEENDIFYNQYLEAAAMLEDIVASDESDKLADWMKTETENNIIAFCGERGEGKSSAMFTFINAVFNKEVRKNSTVFAQCENVKNTIFSEPIVIDPSAFDNVHNVLDIIIASLYRKFSDKYDASSEQFDNYRREKLLNEFQKVYKDISLINDPAKMLEEEYDYEGSIEKISKMGESLRLRLDLSNLVKLYLDYMMSETAYTGCISKKLLIAIDDLDMCNANAYKMAEQIRKYLIIPDIVIVMALKVEQLQLCVQEENFKNYSNVLKNQGKIEGAMIDVEDMAERYIAKLIPKSRRIYLPNVRYIENAKISYQKRNEEIIYVDKMTDSLNASLLDLIYMKTGMRFLLNEEKLNWLQPDNLRDAVNLIVLLGDMKVPENDSEYSENIEKFTEYYVKEWIPQNCQLVNYKEIQNLIRVPYLQLNSEVWYMLNKNYQNVEKRYPLLPADFLMDRANCFFWIMNWFWGYQNSMYDKKDDQFAYIFKILYTIKLSKLRRNVRHEGMGEFLEGYIWGPNFDVMLPRVDADGTKISRARVYLSTLCVYNIINSKLANLFNEKTDLLDVNKTSISKIVEKDDQKEYIIFTWILLGLLANTFHIQNMGNEVSKRSQVQYSYSIPIIFENYRLNTRVQICLENYIIGICSLESLYQKLNMDILGVSKREFEMFTNRIEQQNREVIETFRTIFSNIDLIMRFQEYCTDPKRKQSKASGEKDEAGRTKAVVDRFFRNVEHFCKDYIKKDFNVQLNCLILQNSKGKRVIFNISEVYASCVLESIEEFVINRERQKEEQMRKLMDCLNSQMTIAEPLKNVSTYLKNKSPKNAKKNIENLVHNIKCYYVINNNKILDNRTFDGLINYYQKIIEYELQNPNSDIPDELSEEYRRVVKGYSKYNEEK
ncbi:MAG: hypothetical protein JTJ28_18550 [Lactobacillus sp.]|nr:hypothetical protein [Lactobacillus sp.]